MTKELTLKDLQAKKEQLAEDITEIVENFIEEVGLQPDISIEYHSDIISSSPKESGKWIKIGGGLPIIKIEVRL